MSHKIKIKDIGKLAELQCTKKEAAGYLGISTTTFNFLLEDERALAAWENGLESGKVSLRRKQNRLASTAPAMAIFLGKQYLGQTDINKHEHSGLDGGPIESVDFSKLNDDERAALRRIISKSRTTGSSSTPTG